jgi:hypothetical protein
VENLLGHGNAIRLATEYDGRIVVPLLIIYFELLNPSTINAPVDVVGEEFEKIMFGVGASFEESSHALVIGKLSVFKRLHVLPFACVDPLAWWRIHEG